MNPGDEAIENGFGILIVEDESLIASDIKLTLESMGYLVVGIASRPEQALSFVDDPRLKLVLMDVNLRGEEDGIALAARIRAARDVPVVYLTAYSDEKTLARAMEASSYGYVVKPFQNRELRISIELAMYKHGYETELKREIEMAREANRLKNEFLSNIGHELKTPLNSIIGFTALAIDRVGDREVQEYMDIVSRSAKTLLSMISTLLDMIKLENGMFSMISSEFLLSKTVSECLDVCAVNAHQKGIELFYSRRRGARDYLVGDERIIRQVLINVLDNAIKFTDSGFVRLEVWTECGPGGACDVLLRVEDTGIGISKDDLDRIFERFVQLDGGIKRKFGGSGLGLAIVRGFVELVNGSIDVKSEKGRGSVFTMRIPMRSNVGDPSPIPAIEGNYVFVGFPTQAEADLVELASGATVTVSGIQADPAKLPDGSIVVYADDAIADALYPGANPEGTMLDLDAVRARHEIVVASRIGVSRSREVTARGIQARFVSLPIRESFFSRPEETGRGNGVDRSVPFENVRPDASLVRRCGAIVRELHQLSVRGDEAMIEKRLKECGDAFESEGDEQAARFMFMMMLELRKRDAAVLRSFLEVECLPACD